MKVHEPTKLEELLLSAIEGQKGTISEQERAARWRALREHLDTLERNESPAFIARQDYFSRN
jgi:hypothetical protein